MKTPDIDHLRYPNGPFCTPDMITPEAISSWIAAIEQLPAALRTTVYGLSDRQLDTPYREGGWTVRQVIHHIADSHLNAYTRLRLALTEENPTIKPYHEDRWAELDDAQHAPIDLSLTLIEALHSRWTRLLKSLSLDDFNRSFFHPENEKTFTIGENTCLYAWHGNHHRAQIAGLKERKGWEGGE